MKVLVLVDGEHHHRGAGAPVEAGATPPEPPAGDPGPAAASAGSAREATEALLRPQAPTGTGRADEPGRVVEGSDGGPVTARTGSSPAPPGAEGQADAPPAASASAPRAGRWAVQVASVRDRAEAPGVWRRLAARHPDLAGLEPRVPRAVALPGKGTFYRVTGGSFATEAEARVVCDRLRAAGADCLMVRF